MCDVQEKLIAWMDRELPQEEAANMERHVERCKECRTQLAAYEAVSKNFDVYYVAVAAAKTRRTVPRWAPALAGVAVAMALVFLAFPRRRVPPPPVFTPVAAVDSLPVSAPERAPRKAIQKRHASPGVKKQSAKWQATETAVQIAIPAEAMFAPGAMPEGMSFIAELSIAPDGSVQQVRLRQ